MAIYGMVAPNQLVQPSYLSFSLISNTKQLNGFLFYQKKTKWLFMALFSFTFQFYEEYWKIRFKITKTMYDAYW